MAYPNRRPERLRPRLRFDAYCKPQISRLPCWRPGDFVVFRGGRVDYIEALHGMVSGTDPEVHWMLWTVSDMEDDWHEVERMATFDEAFEWLTDHPDYIDSYLGKRPEIVNDPRQVSPTLRRAGSLGSEEAGDGG